MDGGAHRPEPRDPPASEDFGCELTRTDSDASSVTVDNSRLCVLQDRNAALGQSTVWTNEKHNSYLDSLEASFIAKLHSSLDLPSRGLMKKRIGTALSCASLGEAAYPSDQFAVLQGGSWQRKIYEKDQFLAHSATGSHLVTGSAWIRHFSCSDNPGNIQSMTGPMYWSEKSSRSQIRICTLELTSSESPLFCCQGDQDEVSVLAEGSDQNFVDRDRLEKTADFPGAKRLKKAAYASSEHQVVPSGNILKKEISNARDPSSEEEQVHKQWSSASS